MNRVPYESDSPRLVFACVAFVMSCTTLGVLALLPASLYQPSPQGASIISPTHEGSCFCGAVQITATGAPVAEGFCHCRSCRSWSAAPVNAFTLWKPDAVKVVKGNDYLRGFRKTERSDRKFCNLCGGHVMTNHPGFGLVDLYAATIPSHVHAPALHVHYGESVLPMHDGLPKFRDMPSDMGGSGALCAE